jgi:hypothetical protein
LIRWIWAFIDRPMDRFEESAAFWTTVTGSRLSIRRGAASEFATLLPPEGDACLKVQGVRDTGGAHLDLDVDDVPAAVQYAGELGATLVGAHAGWSVMRAPGGQLFCLVPWEGAAVRPPVVTHQDGSMSRLDQVCIDIAPAAYIAEVAFWTALTGWPSHRSALPEFDLLKPPATLPIRILLQRLGSDRPTSAHLDLACSDVEAIRSWHEECGARLVARQSHWVVMEDPVGGSYCLTGRDPQTSMSSSKHAASS